MTRENTERTIAASNAAEAERQAALAKHADVLDALVPSDAGHDRAFDLVGTMMAYEDGDLDDATTVALFQYLLDHELLGHLQGHYGRQAERMLAEGAVTMPAPKPLFWVVAGNLAGEDA